MPLRTGVVVTAARETGDGVELSLSDGGTRGFDHVLLGTGYEVDVARYPFLDRALAERVERVGGVPHRLPVGLASHDDPDVGHDDPDRAAERPVLTAAFGAGNRAHSSLARC